MHPFYVLCAPSADVQMAWVNALWQARAVRRPACLPAEFSNSGACSPSPPLPSPRPLTHTHLPADCRLPSPAPTSSTTCPPLENWQTVGGRLGIVAAAAAATAERSPMCHLLPFTHSAPPAHTHAYTHALCPPCAVLASYAQNVQNNFPVADASVLSTGGRARTAAVANVGSLAGGSWRGSGGKEELGDARAACA